MNRIIYSFIIIFCYHTCFAQMVMDKKCDSSIERGIDCLIFEEFDNPDSLIKFFGADRYRNYLDSASDPDFTESFYSHGLFRLNKYNEYVCYSKIQSDSLQISAIELSYKSNKHKEVNFIRDTSKGRFSTKSGLYLGMSLKKFMKLKMLKKSDMVKSGIYLVYANSCGDLIHIGNDRYTKFYSLQNRFTFYKGKLFRISIGSYPFGYTKYHLVSLLP